MAISVSASGAFVAGILNFFASCLLPLVPLYIAHLGQSGASSQTVDERTRRIRLGSIGFVLSFAIIFIILGVGARGLVSLSFAYTRPLEVVGGFLLLIFTIPLLPLKNFTPLHRERKFSLKQFNQPFLNGLFLGLVFAVAWSPCIGPVLGAVLTLAASRPTYMEGVVLTSYYAAGLAVPFLLIAFIGESVTRSLRPSKKWVHFFRGTLILFIVFEALILISGKAGAVFAWLSQIIRIGSV